MRRKFSITSLVLFLLLSQFATLAHAVEHQVVPDDNEHCLICAHANDNSNAIAHPQHITSLVLSTFENLFSDYIRYDLKAFTVLNIRSPPTHP